MKSVLRITGRFLEFFKFHSHFNNRRRLNIILCNLGLTQSIFNIVATFFH